MGRRKKQKEGFDPTTAKDPVPEDSPEVIEAVKEFEQTQSEAITDLMDDAPDSGLPPSDRIKADEEKPQETPSEEPATQEQESTPEAKETEGETQAKAEEQPATEDTTEVKADVPESKPKEEKPSVPEYLSGEKMANYTVEVVSEDGARSVPLQNLVTTYQQFPHYQKRYQELKPIFDLAEKARVGIRDVLPLLELGITTYAKQSGIVKGSQPPVGGTVSPDGYQGPFKDREQDEFYKEADPDLYAAMHRLNSRASGFAELKSEIDRIRQERITPTGIQQQQPDAESINKVFDSKISSWSGDHTDYFTAPNVGEVRLEAFKRFIIKNHSQSGLKIKDLTPDFLQAEFTRFDPQYTVSYMQKIAQKKADKAKNDSGLFAEGTGIRSTAEPLSDEQKLMADLF